MEINFKNGSKSIERIEARSAVAAHHKAFAKYSGLGRATVLITDRTSRIRGSGRKGP